MLMVGEASNVSNSGDSLYIIELLMLEVSPNINMQYFTHILCFHVP